MASIRVAVNNLFSAYAEVVPPSCLVRALRRTLLRVCGGSSLWDLYHQMNLLLFSAYAEVVPIVQSATGQWHTLLRVCGGSSP